MASDQSRSLVSGTDAATRALFHQILVANGAPSAATDGVGLGMTARIDVVLQEDAGGTFDAVVWWFYSDAGIWVKDSTSSTISVSASSTAGSTTSPRAASKIYVQALNFVGGGRASAWAIGRGTAGRWQS